MEKDEKLDLYLNRIDKTLKRYIDVARYGGGIKRYPGLKNKLIGIVKNIFKLSKLYTIEKGLTYRMIYRYISRDSLNEFGYRISLNLRYRSFVKNLDRFEYVIVGSKALYNNYEKYLSERIKLIYLPPLIPMESLYKKDITRKDVGIFLVED